MSYSPAYDIATMIQASDMGFGTLQTDLFVGEMPTSPNNCIAVYDTGGYEPSPGMSYERPTVMIKVRNTSYDAGFTIAQQITNDFNGRHNEEYGLYRYIGIWVVNGPNALGKDDNNRNELSINLRIHRTLL